MSSRTKTPLLRTNIRVETGLMTTPGREVHIEFTDGTEFTVTLTSTTTVDAKYYRDRGGELEVLREFRDSSTPQL